MLTIGNDRTLHATYFFDHAPKRHGLENTVPTSGRSVTASFHMASRPITCVGKGRHVCSYLSRLWATIGKLLSESHKRCYWAGFADLRRIALLDPRFNCSPVSVGQGPYREHIELGSGRGTSSRCTSEAEEPSRRMVDEDKAQTGVGVWFGSCIRHWGKVEDRPALDEQG